MGTGATARNGSPNITIDVGGVIVQTKAETFEAAKSDIETALASVFERLALQMGAA
jgi:hypothetical protein